MARAAAQSALTAAGLTMGAVTEEASVTVVAGQVLRQTPAAGTRVAPGTAVSLVVSSGVAMVAAPNVVGATRLGAESAIQTAGLTVGAVSSESSSTVPAGNVIRQTPAAGTSVASGSPVDLVVSTGPAMAIVPNVVGMARDAAQAGIAAAQLTVGVVAEQHSDGVQSGLMIGAESRPPVLRSRWGSAVNLVISPSDRPRLTQVPRAVVFDNRNAQAGLTGPTADTVFTIATAVFASQSWRRGTRSRTPPPNAPSTLAIRDASGIQYGPWPDGQKPGRTGYGVDRPALNSCYNRARIGCSTRKPESWLYNATSSPARVLPGWRGIRFSRPPRPRLAAKAGRYRAGGAQVAVPPGALDAPAQFVLTVGGAPEPRVRDGATLLHQRTAPRASIAPLP